MWANLLAGQSTGSQNMMFINILKELTKNSAILLDEIYQKAIKDEYDPNEDFLDSTIVGAEFASFDDRFKNMPYRFFVSGATASQRGQKTEAATQNFEALEHMKNMGLVKVETHKSNETKNQYTYNTYASITPLGFNFMQACKSFSE